METTHYVTGGRVGVIAAIIRGNWAMELGFRQDRRLLWMIADFVVPRVALVAPYDRHIRQFRQKGKAGGRV